MKKAFSILVSIFSFLALNLQADAGGLVSKLQNQPGKVVLCNDGRPGTEVLFIWTSSAQGDNYGICHTQIVSSGKEAPYTYTADQLKGSLGVMAFVKFAPDTNVGKGQVAVGMVSGRGASISLGHMLNMGQSSYVEAKEMNEAIKKFGINDFSI